jgi:RNA polymerase sigma-54 factor
MGAQSQILSLKQSQNLVMTQQMQQSLKILQMSSTELLEYIDQEIESNPLLEKENEEEISTEQNNDETKEQTNDENDDENSETVEEIDFLKDNNQEIDNENIGDAWNTSETFENEYTHKENDFSEQDFKDKGGIIEKTYSEQISLQSYLLDQINLTNLTQKEKFIATHLIDMLDKNGYLQSENLDEELLALSKKVGCELADVTNLIPKLQNLEPTGIFARNLKECLKLQLKEQNRLDPLIEALLENLELLAKGELQKLKKICNSTDEDLSEMIKEIKSLNPRPASNFSTEVSQTKIPDMFLVQKDKKYTIELNYEVLPKIFLRKELFNNKKINEKDAKKFISEKINTGNFLLRAVAQRTQTMLKVANLIVEKQKDFFDKGINFLKPMIMKDISELAEIHESTVGRVVANKYLSTSRGVFELKYFFTQSLGGSYSDDLFSSETVKFKIKNLINEEKDVLSDEEISLLLKREGINVARRTVAKYRESLNIPTSSERKRLKRIN